MQQVVIIGAGVGGLTAAIRLAQQGCGVTVIEARDRSGGLAAGFELDGLKFDAGPYILLDRPGLEWAFQQLELDVNRLDLRRIGEVYDTDIAGQTFRMFDSLDETAAGIESRWPGFGKRYREFVAQMHARYARLQPLQCAAHPRLGDLLRTGAWRDIPYLLRSLGSILASFKFPPDLAAALGVWTHVAGQSLQQAPSPLALVPAVIHAVGAYYPRGGISAIPELLSAAAQCHGVDFQFGMKVSRIRCRHGTACGVELSNGAFLAADAVVSDIGVGTYLQLLDDAGRSAVPTRTQRMWDCLPLQSPGVCAYLAVKGGVRPPYLRFHIRDEFDGCRLLITPSVLEQGPARSDWSPARLIAPLQHARTESQGEVYQRDFLRRVLAETWWQNHFAEFRVLATRIPQEWGTAYHLFRNSMNPVMTAAFMRAGRLAHRSPWIRHLYLTGSATHPGQWVSFCAVAGVLTANQVLLDRRR